MAKCPMSQPSRGWELLSWGNRSYNPAVSKQSSPGGPQRPRSGHVHRLDEGAALLPWPSQSKNYMEIVRGEISSMFFQNKWEKRQRECTVWRAGKKDAKQLWHKLPVLQDSSTSTALVKKQSASILFGLMSGHRIRPTDHYKNDGI